jgi:hypothetical protein
MKLIDIPAYNEESTIGDVIKASKEGWHIAANP